MTDMLIKTPKLTTWSPRTIGWLTLIFGIPAGFILAAINWFRLKKYQKGVLHLLFGLLTTPFVSLINYFNENQPIFGIILYCLVTFLVIAYLYRQTQKDIEQLENSEFVLEKANWISALGIAILIVLFVYFPVTYFFNVIEEKNQVARQEYLGCELAQVGMSKEEVNTIISTEIGTFGQADFSEIADMTSGDVETFRVGLFEDPEIEKQYPWLGLGYDEEDQLILITIRTLHGFEEVICP